HSLVTSAVCAGDGERAADGSARRGSSKARLEEAMTSYFLFAGFGFLIYVGLAYAEATFAGFSGASFAFVSNLVAAIFLFCAYYLLGEQYRREHDAESQRSSVSG